jgi:Domain of unknown function (DUF1127)
MSISLFRFPPDVFVKYDDHERQSVRPGTTRKIKGAPKHDSSVTEPVLLRDDHIILLAIDGLLALHAVAKRYIARRRTHRILSALDDRQLHDIGLTRGQIDDGKIG